MAAMYDEYQAEIKVLESAPASDRLLRINGAWQAYLSASGLGDFQAIWHCRDGEIIKERPGLEIRRLPLPAVADKAEPQVLFIKKHIQQGCLRHDSEGLKEFANYCDFRRRGLATAVPVAAGCAAAASGEIHSFLVTRDFAPFVDLEELVLNRPGLLAGPANAGRKRNILGAVARYARAMHGAGCNQQDFNATHVLLAGLDDARPRVALFDLQRVDSNPLRRLRWPVKALAELFFSLPTGLFDEDDRRLLFAAYKDKKHLSWLDRLQYGWIKAKMARIARHTRKRNLAPKMRE